MPRIAGFIRTLNRVGIGSKHEMQMGVIESRPDSQFFAWTSHDLYRDGTRAKADEPCTFEMLAPGHASNISTVDLKTS